MEREKQNKATVSIWIALFKYLERFDTAAAIQSRRGRALPVIGLIVSNYTTALCVFHSALPRRGGGIDEGDLS